MLKLFRKNGTIHFATLRLCQIENLVGFMLVTNVKQVHLSYLDVFAYGNDQKKLLEFSLGLKIEEKDFERSKQWKFM